MTQGAPILPVLPEGAAPRDFAAVVGRLTGANAIAMLAGVASGPIIARALGTEGRGQLAAIVAVLTIAPWALDFGLTQWLSRERARGEGTGALLGAALPLALACSLIGVFGAIPISHALGAGHPVVVTFLQIGLFLMPVSVLLQSLVGLAIGESRWGLFAASKLVTSLLPLVAIVVLALAQRLTVASAATAVIGGGLLGNLLFLRVLRGTGRLRFSRTQTLAAGRFGARTWLSTLALAANNRLDQVLMAGLVSSRQLGLYAVAVSLASLTFSLLTAVASALTPRVAVGDGALAARSCRVTVAIVSAAGVGLAVTCPVLIPWLFGREFSGAVPMAVVLLVASVPMAAAFVLVMALAAANNPGAALRAELVGLALTVPALIVLLPSHGGLAAALISLVAYSARLAVALHAARGTFGVGWSSFVVPTRPDVAYVLARARALVARRAAGRGA